LFLETRPTLVFASPDPKNFIGGGEIFRAQFLWRTGCFLIMHHVRIIFPVK